MMHWTEEDEKLFRLALSVRQEREPARFNNYFFDASTVYVYMSEDGAPFDFITNGIHEIGHTLLANTPLGFLHQSLFELTAIAGDYLYNYLSPVLKEHLEIEAERGQRSKALKHLETIGPRPFAEQEQVKEEARALFQRAEGPLQKALKDDFAKHMAETFLALQERRTLLSEASLLCHEAVATFYQLHEDPETLGRYERFINQWMPEEGRNAVRAQVSEELRRKRTSLKQVWKEGFHLAEEFCTKTGNAQAVFWAGHVAHHFPYQGCDLLDMDSKAFKMWVESTRLGVDLRFRTVAQEPELFAHYQIAKDRGLSTLRYLTREFDIPALDNNTLSFQHWHARYILGSALCAPIRHITPPRSTELAMTDDNWSERMMPTQVSHLLPPFVFESGRVLAPNESLQKFVKQDFIRAVRVKSVQRILSLAISQ